jgi:hypothetical protein
MDPKFGIGCCLYLIFFVSFFLSLKFWHSISSPISPLLSFVILSLSFFLVLINHCTGFGPSRPFKKKRLDRGEPASCTVRWCRTRGCGSVDHVEGGCGWSPRGVMARGSEDGNAEVWRTATRGAEADTRCGSRRCWVRKE